MGITRFWHKVEGKKDVNILYVRERSEEGIKTGYTEKIRILMFT